MKKKVMLALLLVSSLLVGSSGVTFLYSAKEMIDYSNQITYSHTERLEIFDKLIEKAKQEEYDKETYVNLFTSWKEREMAEHKFTLAATSFFDTAIAVVVAAQLLQLILLASYFRKP